jgi:hypothetical protein
MSRFVSPDPRLVRWVSWRVGLGPQPVPRFRMRSKLLATRGSGLRDVRPPSSKSAGKIIRLMAIWAISAQWGYPILMTRECLLSKPTRGSEAYLKGILLNLTRT